MPLQAEIQSREQSLAALMTRILQDPLRPIEQSLQRLGGELTDAQEKLEHLHQLMALASSLGPEVAKTVFYAKKVVNESVPDLKAHLAEHVSAVSKDHRQAIEAAITAHADRGALMLNAVAGTLSAGLNEAAARHLETSALIGHARLELSELIKEVGSGLQAALEKQQQQLRSLHALSDSHHAALILERERLDRAVADRFEEFTALWKSATEERDAALHHQIESYRHRVGQLILVVGMVVAGALGLAGFIGFQLLGRAS